MKQLFKMIFASCLGVVIAGVILLVVFFSMLGSFTKGISDLFNGDTKSVTTHASKESLLSLDLKGALSDTNEPESPLDLMYMEMDKQHYSLSEVLKAIDIAKEEPKVEGIVLKLEECSMGFAAAHQLREKLQEFKGTGKKIYAFADIYSYGSYFVSSIADKVYMNPYGVIEMMGLSSVTTFFSGPLRKLGVEMQVFKVGTFKGAVEPFINNKLSAENRFQIQTFLDGLWKGTTDAIAKSRGISSERLQEFADLGMTFKKEAVGQYNLVDSLVYGEDLSSVISKDLFDEERDEVQTLSVRDLLSMEKRASHKSEEKVVVLFAEGPIQNIKAEQLPPLRARTKTISSDLVKRLRKISKDEDVKAVVLRVNSPGGDAYLSELIHHEVKRLKAEKPVVVSMGNYAASGGYYIACAANTIVADPYTLTGSIGIYGLFPNFTGTAKKLDLTHETVSTAKFADLGNAIREMTPDEKALIQESVNDGYKLFVSRVAEGRKMTYDQVDSIAQGRVWLGEKALEIGLVDRLGNLDIAIQEAVRLANLEEYEVDYYHPKQSFLEQLLSLSNSTSLSNLISWKLLTPQEKYLKERLEEISHPTGILAMPLLPLEIKGFASTTHLDN